MPEEAATVPKITGFAGIEADGTDFLIWFACADGKKYKLPVANSAFAAIVDGLNGFIPPGVIGPSRPTVDVEESQAVARPDGSRALLFRTRQMGTIAFALTDEGIRVLLRDLADLQRVQTPSGNRQ